MCKIYIFSFIIHLTTNLQKIIKVYWHFHLISQTMNNYGGKNLQIKCYSLICYGLYLKEVDYRILKEKYDYQSGK